MVKTVNLPQSVYEELVNVSDELSLMAKKAFSPAMAVDMLVEIYHAHLSNPCALDAFSQQLRSLNIMSPEEFEKYWDVPVKEIQNSGRSKSKKH
jgi:hypothetical protein